MKIKKNYKSVKNDGILFHNSLKKFLIAIKPFSFNENNLLYQRRHIMRTRTEILVFYLSEIAGKEILIYEAIKRKLYHIQFEENKNIKFLDPKYDLQYSRCNNYIFLFSKLVDNHNQKKESRIIIIDVQKGIENCSYKKIYLGYHASYLRSHCLWGESMIFSLEKEEGNEILFVAIDYKKGTFSELEEVDNKQMVYKIEDVENMYTRCITFDRTNKDIIYRTKIINKI